MKNLFLHRVYPGWILTCRSATGLVFIMFSLFGCGQPRKTKNDVQSWLDRHFPGQLEVVSSTSGATWNNYNTALVNLEIGARDDAEVRFRVQAHKDREENGLDRETIETQLKVAREDVGHGRALLALLKSHGLERVSAGVAYNKVDIMVFQELTPACREPVFNALRQAIEAWPAAYPPGIRILFMEEASFGERFQEIVPTELIHAGPPNSWVHDNTVYDFATFWTSLPSNPAMEAQLRVTAGKRLTRYIDEAYPEALAFARKALKKEVQVEKDQMIGYEQEPGHLRAIRFSFPYCLKAAESCDGRYDGAVSCRYHVETKTVSDLELKEED